MRRPPLRERVLVSALPITQQLARLDEGLIGLCKRDVRRLDDLCSFRSLEPDDYLDLDWSPAILEGAALFSRVPSERLQILAHATGGKHELNPAYRDLPSSIWQHPVTYNPADQVLKVHSILRALAGAGFPAAAATRAAVAQLDGGVSSADAPEYLGMHFEALNDVYCIAAARGLHVAMWWD